MMRGEVVEVETVGERPGACVRCGAIQSGNRFAVRVEGRQLGAVCTSCVVEVRSGLINGSHELRAATVAGSESGGQ